MAEQEKTEEVKKEEATEDPAEKPAERPQAEKVTEGKGKEGPVKEKKAEKKETEKEAGLQPELSDKLKKIVESVEKLTVLELSSLVKAMEEKFGVTASAPAVAVAAAPAAGAAAAPAEEKTSFDVILAKVGAKKIQVIKEIRTVTTLGLKEAKELVDSAPKPIKEGVPKEEAEQIKAKLEAVGAAVELK